MNTNEIKLKETISKVLKINIDLVTEEASPDTIEAWDSLAHMNLVIALEEAFHIELTDDQVIEILSYKLIKIILSEQGVQFT